MSEAPAGLFRDREFLRLELIGEACELARSHAVSASEAAARDDRLLIDYHLGLLRECVITAIETYRELGKP